MKDDRLYLIHFGECIIDLEEIWNIVELDLPVLKCQVEELLQELGGG